MENRPEEALPMLEAALAEEPENDKIYVYLGIIYEQIGEYEKSISILRVGLRTTGEKKEKMYFNMGNNYFALSDKEQAENMYSKAIETNGGFADAYLNRANTRLSLEKKRDAVDDYTAYLSLRPSAAQRDKIEQVVGILRKEIAEEERRKEEERRRLEEERRRKEEERRKQEEAKRRQEALLRDVLKSLETASEETTSKSADAEDIEDFEMELELDE